jgi:hypothetical protein
MTAALLAVALLAQTPPAAGPLLDRWEARFDDGVAKVESLRVATELHSARVGALGDNVKEAIEVAKGLGVGAFWLVVLAIGGALAYKVLDIAKAGMMIFAAARKET